MANLDLAIEEMPALVFRTTGLCPDGSFLAHRYRELTFSSIARAIPYTETAGAGDDPTPS